MVPSLRPLTLQNEPLQVSNTELYINFKWQPFTKYSKQNLEIKHIMRKTNRGEVIVLEREKKRTQWRGSISKIDVYSKKNHKIKVTNNSPNPDPSLEDKIINLVHLVSINSSDSLQDGMAPSSYNSSLQEVISYSIKQLHNHNVLKWCSLFSPLAGLVSRIRPRILHGFRRSHYVSNHV